MRDSELRDFGRAAAAEFDTPSSEDMAEERRVFLAAVEEPPHKAKNSGALWLVAATVVVGVGAMAVLFGHSSPSTSETDHKEHARQWVRNRANGHNTILFSGGSRFVLGATSDASVVTNNQDEVVVALHRGSVACVVHGDGRTKWRIQAGDYRVTVTGTRFSVSWVPPEKKFHVAVAEGSVWVQGGVLSSAGVALGADDRLVVDANGVTVRRHGRETSRTQSAQAAPQHRHPAVEPQHGPGHPVRNGARSSARTRAPQKAESAYSDAELWRLANRARYSGRTEEAYRYFKSLWETYPRSVYADQAIFLLGRLCSDARKKPREAMGWFARYLRTAPHGRLAEQALGRLVQLCRDAGDPCARKYAADYVERFPNGPWAPLSRAVLE